MPGSDIVCIATFFDYTKKVAERNAGEIEMCILKDGLRSRIRIVKFKVFDSILNRDYLGLSRSPLSISQAQGKEEE
jgi:hypothetical protein